MVENIQKNQTAAQLVAIDGFLVLAGGVPVKLGKETIGAIGVGGAPGGHLDEACANAAIAKVQDQLKQIAATDVRRDLPRPTSREAMLHHCVQMISKSR
jgi:hypothetical protein